MKIKEIKKLKNERYKITLENGEAITLHSQVMIDYHLLYQKEIDLFHYEELMRENHYWEVYQKVVKNLLRKLRSKREIDIYLEKFDLSKEQKERLQEKLSSLHLVDDVRYAKSYVADKIHLTNDGPLKIKKDLENLGIDEAIIIDTLSALDQAQLRDKASRLIQKKIRMNHKYSTMMLKQKIKEDLIRLGYETDMILELLEVQAFPQNDLIQREYEKQKRKLARKYEGKELERQIRAHLYAKKFTMDEIQACIEKNS